MKQAAFAEFYGAPVVVARGPARRQADTSVIVWRDCILPTLTRREIVVFRALHAYLEHTKHADATGGELTEWMVQRELARDVNGCRPRLTGLADKGWIAKRETTRHCRNYLTEAHPYVPVVPLGALHDLNPNDGGQ